MIQKFYLISIDVAKWIVILIFHERIFHILWCARDKLRDYRKVAEKWRKVYIDTKRDTRWEISLVTSVGQRLASTYFFFYNFLYGVEKAHKSSFMRLRGRMRAIDREEPSSRDRRNRVKGPRRSPRRRRPVHSRILRRRKRTTISCGDCKELFCRQCANISRWKLYKTTLLSISKIEYISGYAHVHTPFETWICSFGEPDITHDTQTFHEEPHNPHDMKLVDEKNFFKWNEKKRRDKPTLRDSREKFILPATSDRLLSDIPGRIIPTLSACILSNYSWPVFTPCVSLQVASATASTGEGY